jgi:alkylation response protein AidB-like acyl-CoA dehydrogenase
MDFAFSEEQEFLRSTAREWLGAKAPSGTVRALMETESGYDEALWREIADLGWQAMAIPEAHGGAGFGFLELAVLLEEMGRSLFPAPFLSTVVMAATAIQRGGDDDQKSELLAAIAAGELVATVAMPVGAGPFGPEDLDVVATDGTLSGAARFVLDGASAAVVVVPAVVDGDLGLFLVERDAAGFSAEPLETLDLTRKLAHLRFDATPVAGRLDGAPAADVLDAVLATASVAMALEQVGGAAEVLDVAVQYAKDRVQFGRPIGSFQAIKHKCADMLVAVESARSAAYYAAWAVAEDNDEVPLVAPLAKAYCSEAFFMCAAENIQIHGGIGFTWEHDAHLYFKRAKSGETLLGSPAEHRARLADRLGI